VALDRVTLMGIANAERMRLGRTIQYAPPESWEAPSACKGWWNRDVVAHMAAQDTSAAQLVKGDAATELDEYRDSLGVDAFTVDGFNAVAVNRRSGLAVREVLTQWGRAADSFLAFATILSDDEWSAERIPWLSGDIALPYLVQSRIIEWWLHGEDMRATNGLGPNIQHWPVHLTCDMGIRMLPWALARAGLDFSGLSVQVDLEGAGYGSWHWGLGAGETPPEDKKPDAYIQGRAVQFALVAGRRLPADEVLDAGTLVVGGEAALGELILTHIRAYV
jgi:uncharacterized protein (TIGR03083 family)